MKTEDTKQFQEFEDAYIRAALWSSLDQSDEQGGEPLDHNYAVGDFDSDSLQVIRNDCLKFYKEHKAFFLPHASLAGHDFWLTRNGHGAGFWDGDWPEHGEALTQAANAFGECHIFVNDECPFLTLEGGC